jgi:hypothetical protein
MSNARTEYLKDLIKDCKIACEAEGIEEEDRGVVIASMILSDSLNGLRKALLTPAFAAARRPYSE